MSPDLMLLMAIAVCSSRSTGTTGRTRYHSWPAGCTGSGQRAGRLVRTFTVRSSARVWSSRAVQTGPGSKFEMSIHLVGCPAPLSLSRAASQLEGRGYLACAR